MKKTQIKQLIEEGSVDRVKAYMALFPDQKNNPLNRFGWTAVHLAVEYHKLPVLKYLVEEENVDVRHLDNAGSTLLHHALYFVSTKEEWDIVKYLLESARFKFDSLKDDNGNTTLHLAFRNCNLKQIADLNPYYKGLKEVFQTRNNHKQTPLMILRERVKGSPESLKIVDQLQEEIEGAPEPAPPPKVEEKWGGMKSEGKPHRFTGRPRGYMRAKMKSAFISKSDSSANHAPPPSAPPPAAISPKLASMKSPSRPQSTGDLAKLKNAPGHGGSGIAGHGHASPAIPHSTSALPTRLPEKKMEVKKVDDVVVVMVKKTEEKKVEEVVAAVHKEEKKEEKKVEEAVVEEEKKEEKKIEDAVIAAVVEEIKKAEESSSSENEDASDSLCENCDKSLPAVRYCEDCDSTLCVECLESHDKLRVMQGHSVIGVVGQCQSCDGGHKPSAYCQECACDICDNCVADHKRLKITKDHEVISLKEKRTLGLSDDYIAVDGKTQ